MNKLVTGSNALFHERVAEWVMRRAGVGNSLLHPGEFYTIAVTRDGTLAAAALYHNYCRMGTGGRVEISMAADDPRWLDRGVIRGLLHYPFFQLNCHVVVCTTGESNLRTIKLLTGLGFEERGRLPCRPYCEDTITFSLSREVAVSKWNVPELREAA